MELYYIIDAVLVLLFVLTVLNSARVGLAKSLAGILAWIAASVIALHCCAPLAERTYVYVFQDRVVASLQENIDAVSDDQEIFATVNSSLQVLPRFIVEAAKAVGMDTEALIQKSQAIDTAKENAAQTVERTVFAPVYISALKAVMFLILLIVCTVFLRLILNPICKLIKKVPFIGGADRALGGVLGILKGAALVAVLAILAKIAAAFAEGPYAQAVLQSRLINFIAESPFANGFFA